MQPICVIADVAKRCGTRAVRPIPALRFADVRVGVAQSQEEFDAAHGLVRQRYGWRGYDFAGASGCTAARERMRRCNDITFVAARRDATVGTITLALDGPCGLRAEGTHREVVAAKRGDGRRLCELTRLAVADSADSKPVLASLFNLAYEAADTIHGVTDVFIEVNPRHVAFYSRVLGFAVAAGETFCVRVQARSVLLHTEMATLAGRLGALARRAMLPPVLSRAA